VHPATFVAFKRWMANQADREALKRSRDVLQADAVQELLDKYLPLSPPVTADQPDLPA
jgi:Nucleotidyltransferase